LALNIITVVGARPQFIKAAAVSRAVRECDGVSEKIIHTGQHYDHGMSEIFFAELDIPAPAYNLGIGSSSHGKQTGLMLAAIEDVLHREKPAWVLVYGDTNSTLAGALAASKLHIPIAHVEAGLRSFNRAMPEEINRVVTDHVADLLLAPTHRSVTQLLNEGIDSDNVRLVGDVMFDAALYYAERSRNRRNIAEQLALEFRGFALATVHRAENTDNPSRLKAILNGLCGLASHLPVVLPLHPRTRRSLANCGLMERAQTHLRLIEPVGYLDMIQLEQQAGIIVTDSGGVQKEAFFFRTPCVTLREETEWTELVEHGYNKLVGCDTETISTAAVGFGHDTLDWDIPLYGDGRAASRIIHFLKSFTTTTRV
jgi:UDP-GlcNAc3NAcA epimerase